MSRVSIAARLPFLGARTARPHHRLCGLPSFAKPAAGKDRYRLASTRIFEHIKALREAGPLNLVAQASLPASLP
jgi:hypothetical protein